MNLQMLAVKIHRLGIPLYAGMALALTYMYAVLKINEPGVNVKMFLLTNPYVGVAVATFYAALIGLGLAGYRIVAEIRQMYMELLARYADEEYTARSTEIHQMIVDALRKAGYEEELVNYALFGVEESSVVFKSEFFEEFREYHMVHPKSESLSTRVLSKELEFEATEEIDEKSTSEEKVEGKSETVGTPEKAFHAEGLPSDEVETVERMSMKETEKGCEDAENKVSAAIEEGAASENVEGKEEHGDSCEKFDSSE